ncbi:MAG: YbaB/EbfC family nucleoid-associated protein [Clostridiales bacterium]|jgi:DNA-binding YbaB/EbfC family protein|nr:YbaB/EbfC family nucleoid-associated protein [Clostridiales bacterium]
MAGFKGGFGGGNMGQLMAQAQKMQQQMLKAQEELAESEVTGMSGGGLVEVVLTGDKKFVSISIKPDAVDPDDVEMLEDLIAAAFNDAMNAAEELNKKTMGPFGNLGGLM